MEETQGDGNEYSQPYCTLKLVFNKMKFSFSLCMGQQP